MASKKLAQKNMPLPMKLRVGSLNDLKRTNSIFEPKLDGIRALCFVNADLRFITRSARDITDKYPELAFRKQIKAKQCVLDGEIIATDKKGRSRFQLLQEGYQAQYIVFDILSLQGKSLMEEPLLERKKILDKTVADGGGIEKIIYTDDGLALWKLITERELEGVIAKEKTSRYLPDTRSSIWLKIKRFSDIDAAIIGFTKGPLGLGALALGLYSDGGSMRYIGKVGTGFSQAERDDLLTRLKRTVRKTSPVSEEVKDVTWVKPTFVAQVKYVEITKAGRLRTPSFIRIRDDKRVSGATVQEQWPI